ncbi:MAG: hypothetical protein IKO19_02385 [Candidatus Riflebacteria bacterium]|nr:hypothetical protein [Candidatus Riflebacteria bacterium]MBR4569506.1 hypothetical protein [Candidatus Riflebacteria bacterium]
MRNYKGFFKSYKLGLTAVVLAASLIASPSLYSGPFDDESISVSETADTSTVSNTDSIKITITDTKTAEEAGINEIQEGYPINGVVVANTLRLRSWPWGEVTAKYHKGQSLKVLGESGEFYLVEIDGRQGYMHKSYITTDKASASYAAPTYPGDTRSGGYVPLKDGVQVSKTGKTQESSSNTGSSSTGSTNSSGSVNNISTADYTGVTKVIFDIVKKFCDANQQYVLGAAHSKNSGYATKSDCSGFTGQFINKLSEMAGVNPVIGNSFPTSTNYANSQYTQKVTGAFPPPNPKDLIKPGDIFVMSKSSPSGYGHVGVFMGYNSAGQPLIAHSTTRKVDGSTTIGNLGTTGVRVEVIPSWYNKRWMGVYRLNNMDQIAKNLES